MSVFAQLLGAALAQSPPVAPPGYVAVPELSDEFNEGGLDMSKWTDIPKVCVVCCVCVCVCVCVSQWCVG